MNNLYPKSKNRNLFLNKPHQVLQNVNSFSAKRIISQTKSLYLLLLMLAFLPASIVLGQTTVTFSATTTWTCPNGVTSIIVECWGGGGAGGAATGNVSAGGGGAGGSYVKNIAIPVTPGVDYNVNVGTGGTGDGNGGNPGNDSWFKTAGTILAKGGNGGARANSSGGNGSGGTALATGNVGYSGVFNYYGGAGGAGGTGGSSGGGGGSSAGTGSGGNAASGATGGLAVTGGGAGVNGSTSSAAGASNTNLGGGGAGGRTSNNTDRNGGSGGDGQVSITYTQPSCPASTAITPIATQSVCAGSSSNTLTATITLDGVTGTPTLLYQWYYNNSNSNNVGTATLLSGETAATYTPQTAIVGTRYYFCVGYSTNNSCAETNATQSLASNTVQVTVTSSMAGNYLIGAGQTYTTLTAAVAAYNSGCIGGAITFLLKDATYPSEAYPITINANASSSATNTLTIKPNTGINTTITGSLNSNALIRIEGNYVTIDGSNNGTASRNLTITNTNTSLPLDVLIGSTVSSPNTNVTVKNCTLSTGTNTSGYPLMICSATTLGGAGYFNNLTLQNNVIQKATIAIYTRAFPTSGNGNGLLITSNDLTASGTNAIGNVGIYVQDVDGATVSNNSIANFETATAQFDFGVWFASGTINSVVSGNTISNLSYTGAVSNTGPNGIFISTNIGNSNVQILNNTITGISSNGTVPSGGDGTASGINIDFASAGGTVSGNIISNIKNTNAGGYGCNGILLGATAVNAGFTIYNNFIFDIASKGSTSSRGYDRNASGIIIASGGGYNIYNNTVLLNTNQTNTGYPAAMNITSGVTAASSLNIQNNIFVNTQTQTGERYAIQSGAANSVYASINYNDYYTSGTNLGYISSNRTNLAAVQSGFGSNLNSLNILPVFVSATDLHIQTSPVVNEPLNNTGTPIAGITRDIDAEIKNVFTPDIGADEFKGRGSWIGGISSTWTTPGNWFDNFVPVITTNIEIGSALYMPDISSSTQPVRNVVIESPGTLTVSGSGTLQISGAISNNGTFTASAGTIEMNGTVAQTIPANTFQGNNVKNLIISNTNNVTGVTLGGNLDIYGSVNFGAGGRKLTTGDLLTFKSTSGGTSWLGPLSATNTIVGAATIERYIPLHAKAWQFLSTPITASSTQTVNQAWQEGSVAANDNLVPGYGTQLTSSRPDAVTHPNPGFDAVTTSPSIKWYNSATGSYKALNRTDTAIANAKGYMLFIRGDRTATGVSSPISFTTLRMKGTLHTPANPPPGITLTTPGVESIGNPYPSPIDFRALTITGGIQNSIFYLWDPNLTSGAGSAYGVGGFRTITITGPSTYTVTPAGGSFRGYIESGQAFLVYAPISVGSVGFSEAAKVTGSADVNRMPVVSTTQMRTNLSVITPDETILVDGNLVQFGRSYSNEIDMDDARKLSNTGENLGLLRDTKTLAVERRSLIQNSDTLFYKLGQLKVRDYELEFIPENFNQPGLQAYLEDSYLHTSKPVSMRETTRIIISIVNVPGSYAANRFRLVFKVNEKNTPVPVDVDIASKSTAINDSLEKQKSSAAETIKQQITDAKPAIHVYPNPVVNKTLQLQFLNQQEGTYSVQLFNKLGQLVYTGSQVVSTENMISSIRLDQGLARGVYQLTITGLEGNKTTQQILIQ